MGLFFEWHKEKARENLQKHGVSFEEATTVFGDSLSLTIGDPQHSDEEDRLIIVGHSYKHRTLVVAHTERGERIRIISGRLATRRERKIYEEGK